MLAAVPIGGCNWQVVAQRLYTKPVGQLTTRKHRALKIYKNHAVVLGHNVLLGH